MRRLLGFLIVFMLVICAVEAGFVLAATSEVSGPRMVTSNSEYDRNPSIVFYSGNYWLFYTKADTFADRTAGNVDADTYVVYYKHSLTVDGLATAAETKLALSDTARPANFDQRVVSAAVIGGDLYAFVSSGQSGTDRGLYYYKYTGAVWSGPTTLIADATAKGGHVNVVSDGATAYIVWEAVDATSDFYTFDGTTLSAKVDISTDNQPKITETGGDLYVVSISDSPTNPIMIYTSGDSGATWSPGTAVDGMAGFYDPTVFVHGGELYVVSAPYDVGDDRQWLSISKSTDGLTGAAWTSEKRVTYGGYDGTYWWDYWPIGYSDGTSAYIFYTTEKDGVTIGGGEIAFLELNWDVNNNHYEAIGPAVAEATAGDDIIVGPGVQVEGAQIFIDKDLTLTGQGPGTTVLSPGVDTAGSGDARGWFLVDTGVAFDISDLTLDGTGYKVYQAIRNKGSGTVDHVIFTEIKYEESGPAYSGVGIAAFGDGPVHVTNSQFSQIGRIGVLYFGTGVSVSVFDSNTYVGKGPGDWLDYALDISAGAVVTVTNNKITNNRGVASVDGSTSAGILVTTYFAPGTAATIENNMITSSTTGVAVGYDSSDTSAVEIHQNNIYGNEFGVTSTAPSVDATLNWWGSKTGPSGEGPGTGDEVSEYVLYDPWLCEFAPSSSVSDNGRCPTDMPDLGEGVGIDMETEDFGPRIFMHPDRSIYHSNANQGLELVERSENYAFEGEQIHWVVVAWDKNGEENIRDVWMGLSQSGQDPGDFFAEAECDEVAEFPDGILWEDFNAKELEEDVAFNEDTMNIYDCWFTVETYASMYGEYFLSVAVEDSDYTIQTFDENEYWFFNPVLAVTVVGDISFGTVRPGTNSYSDTLLIQNSADFGSGVLLNMFISGSDFYDPDSVGVKCPTSNVLELQQIAYYATHGNFETGHDAGRAALQGGDEGYFYIPYETGQTESFQDYDVFGRQEIIEGEGILTLGGQHFQSGNVLTPGGEIAVTFRLTLPEPCTGNFVDGQIFFWGEAI